MIKKIIWIGIVLAILIYTIPKLLESFSVFIETLKGENAEEPVADAPIILPPTVDSVPEATNTAQIAVSGYAENADRVELFVNDISKKDIRVKSSDQSFSTKIPLFEGENAITIIAYDAEGNKSEPTDPIHIAYVSGGPDLIIDAPQDGDEVRGGDGSLEIRGITSNDADVTVNGRWVRVKPDGSFSYTFRLVEGDNEVKIEAKDQAGSVSSTTRRVHYSK